MRASSVLFALSIYVLNDLSQTRAKNSADAASGPLGRLLAIDLGTKRVGVAVCDELRLTVRAVETIERRSWKDLLRRIVEHIAQFEARALVIGLPLNFDGTEGPAATEARQTASKFQQSLKLPVYLQDERLTSEEAKTRLRGSGAQADLDSEAAAVILEDFLSKQLSKA